MLYWILLNFCISTEDILHNMTALSESKSVKNVGVILIVPFAQAFSKRIDRIF